MAADIIPGPYGGRGRRGQVNQGSIPTGVLPFVLDVYFALRRARRCGMMIKYKIKTGMFPTRPLTFRPI